MPIRLLPLIAALWVLLFLPAGARAADYVPDEVLVGYEQGTGGGVAANVAAEAGAEPVGDLPGGSEQLQIEDGDSVRETIAELRADLPDLLREVLDRPAMQRHDIHVNHLCLEPPTGIEPVSKV